MKDYIEINFNLNPGSTGTDILIAFLSEIGFESFSETDSGLSAYIQEAEFKMPVFKRVLQNIPDGIELNYSVERIKSQNWNEVWERSYTPVTIAGLIHVRAPFHPEDKDMKYRLLIEPKMSFGTAHHETTHLMMELMLEEEFSGKKVLDMGCGTGILAILAEMLGAVRVIAIDNDQNAVENTFENVRKNKCRNIHVQHGDAADILGEFNYILANITKNILLDDMNAYGSHLTKGGKFICSGFYENDLPEVESKAYGSGLSKLAKKTRNKWVAATFVKDN